MDELVERVSACIADGVPGADADAAAGTAYTTVMALRRLSALGRSHTLADAGLAKPLDVILQHALDEDVAEQVGY